MDQPGGSLAGDRRRHVSHIVDRDVFFFGGGQFFLVFAVSEKFQHGALCGSVPGN